MLTLVRPPKSKIADEVEKRLKEAYAAYKVVDKQVSDMVYLIEAGNVFQGEEIRKFIEKYYKKPTTLKPVNSDDKFFE